MYSLLYLMVSRNVYKLLLPVVKISLEFSGRSDGKVNLKVIYISRITISYAAELYNICH